MDGNKIDISVWEVLSAPELEINLLSVEKLEMKDFTIAYETAKAIISKGMTKPMLHKGLKNFMG